MENDTKKLYIFICIFLIIIIFVSIINFNVYKNKKTKINICEEYSKMNNIIVEYPEKLIYIPALNRSYTLDEIKRNCLKKK